MSEVCEEVQFLCS